MMATTHGSDAEAMIEVRLDDAIQREDEVQEIVWRGVLTQLSRIRAEDT